MLRNLRHTLIDKTYRVRDEQKKINCPHPDYEHTFIVLPKEWLGEHVIRKDAALEIINKQHKSGDISNFAAAMAIVDDWGNIPGMEKRRPDEWDMAKVPVPIIAWVINEVLEDFAAAYKVPKVS